MTDTTTPSVCPNCQHPHHLPGTECSTPVHHGPSHWHLCLCLARPGAALSCPPQMACQGGTLGYSDIWYLQQGHSLSSADGVISPEVLTVGPVSVGYPPASAVVPAADRAALRDRITEELWPLTEWDGDQLNAERAADVVLSVLPAPADRAAVLEEAADEAERVAESLRAHHEFERSTGALDVMTELRRMAVESAVVDRVAAETPPAETLESPRYPARHSDATVASDMCPRCKGDNTEPWSLCAACEPGPAVEARPGKDTETPQPKEA